MSAADHHNEYTENLIAALQWMWATASSRREERTRSPSCCRAWVVGAGPCSTSVAGWGRSTCCWCGTFGAARVVGIDVEQPLVDHARRRVAEAGLGDRIAIDCVEPGPLDFDGRGLRRGVQQGFHQSTSRTRRRSMRRSCVCSGRAACSSAATGSEAAPARTPRRCRPG